MASTKYRISLNGLAEFSSASDTKKRRIVEAQRNPQPFIVPRYRVARMAIRKSIELRGNLEPIVKTIAALEKKKTTSAWQASERKLSIEALQQYQRMRLPAILRDHKYVKFKSVQKVIIVNDVSIIMSPDLVLGRIVNGKPQIGAIKIHISRGNPFDLTRSRYASSLLYHYLSDQRKVLIGEVLRELCFSIDVFDKRVVPTPVNSEDLFERVEFLCNQVKAIWDSLEI